MDHVADANLATLYRVNQQHSVPDFVKNAHIDREGVAQLPAESFADPEHRRFPCHTRADTWLSYAYAIKNANQVRPEKRASVFANLRKFANTWAIRIECERLEREHEKQASTDLANFADSDFAIVEQHGGQKYRALPLLNAECVKAAAEHIEQYKDRYPTSWRQHAAQAILTKAAEFNVAESFPYLVKAAGYASSCGATLAEGLRHRATLINRTSRSAPEQVSLLKLANAAETGIPRSLLKQAIDLLDKVDAQFGFKRLYSHGLPTPEELAYGGGTHKQASDVKSGIVQLVTGSTYTKSAINRAGLAPYRALGDDMVNAVRTGIAFDINKAAALLPTLPRPDAELLEQAFRAVGVKSASAEFEDAGLPDSSSQWSSAQWSRAVELATV